MNTIVFIIITLLCQLSENAAAIPEEQPVTPVILIPGICGSQVDGWYKKDSSPHVYCTKDSKDWTTLWVCIECMLPPVISCWADTFSLNISDVNNLKNRDGVQTKVNGFGYTTGIGYLDKNRYVVQFEKMIVGLESLPGYKRGISIRGAPYDFRFTPNTEVGKRYMIRLKYLIEETYELNRKTPALIVAHSMGNPILVNFFSQMDQAWKDKYIEGYVALAGVFGGASKTLRALLTGETEGFPEVIVSPITMRGFERTAPTVYWLMPLPKVFGDMPLVFANGRNYTAGDYKELLADAGIPKGNELYNLAKAVPPFNPDIGVDVYCIHGMNQTTPIQFNYPAGTFPDTEPETTNGDGDGTVNLRSLQLCKQFKRLKDYKTVTGFLATHLEILQRKDVIEYISELLTHKNRVKFGRYANTTSVVF